MYQKKKKLLFFLVSLPWLWSSTHFGVFPSILQTFVGGHTYVEQVLWELPDFLHVGYLENMIRRVNIIFLNKRNSRLLRDI